MAHEQMHRFTFDVPGRADRLSEELVGNWNETIRAVYEGLAGAGLPLSTRFFVIDPSEIVEPNEVSIKWPADPAEPAFCIDAAAARDLSDWGVRGRHIHNEYCEYAVVHRRDEQGRLRPKRVQVTTELREYWVCVAKADPDALRRMAEEVLGVDVGWAELYGVADPHDLTSEQREIAVGHTLAGHGNHRHLQEAGVPAQPTGRLNTENALFMSHPFNGLEGLLYIVLFGAKPYAVREGDERRPATSNEIFAALAEEDHLVCRHSDPASALGAHEAAWVGSRVTFENPLGIYVFSFARELFLINDEPVPENWVRWSRGEEDTHQRLEFGPDDADRAFLDDIKVAVGASEEPLVGGYQVVQQIEVGLRVVAGPASLLQEEDYVDLQVDKVSIACHEAGICRGIKQLKSEYDREHSTGRTAPRRMGFGG